MEIRYRDRRKSIFYTNCDFHTMDIIWKYRGILCIWCQNCKSSSTDFDIFPFGKAFTSLVDYTIVIKFALSIIVRIFKFAQFLNTFSHFSMFWCMEDLQVGNFRRAGRENWCARKLSAGFQWKSRILNFLSLLSRFDPLYLSLSKQRWLTQGSCSVDVGNFSIEE
jgi:hypothetical protein